MDIRANPRMDRKVTTLEENKTIKPHQTTMRTVCLKFYFNHTHMCICIVTKSTNKLKMNNEDQYPFASMFELVLFEP